MIATFSLLFGLFARPWRAADPKRRETIGIGAFNLVTTTAYREAGTHERICLRPDDDLKLGKIIKGAGFRQDFLFASSFLEVEWYESLWDMVRGLEKNAFSGVEYRFSFMILGTLGLISLFVWPYAGMFLTSGWGPAANACCGGLVSLLFYRGVRELRLGIGYVPFLPLGVLVYIFILWRAMLKNLRTGGIDWRGTVYPLEELRKNRI